MAVQPAKPKGGHPRIEPTLETEYEAFQLYFQFRELLLKELEDVEFTQRDLASLLVVSEQRISHYLSGGQHRSGCGVTTPLLQMARMAEALGKRFTVELVAIPPR